MELLFFGGSTASWGFGEVEEWSRNCIDCMFSTRFPWGVANHKPERSDFAISIGRCPTFETRCRCQKYRSSDSALRISSLELRRKRLSTSTLPLSHQENSILSNQNIIFRIQIELTLRISAFRFLDFCTCLLRARQLLTYFVWLAISFRHCVTESRVLLPARIREALLRISFSFGLVWRNTRVMIARLAERHTCEECGSKFSRTNHMTVAHWADIPLYVANWPNLEPNFIISFTCLLVSYSAFRRWFPCRDSRTQCIARWLGRVSVP